jgi:hypothetical protein
MLEETVIYEVVDLHSARDFLKKHTGKVILINTEGSTRYYGMLVLDYIFKNLLAEFPEITKIIVNVSDDNAALFTAIKLQYKNIKYSGKSEAARKMIADSCCTLVSD